MQISKNKISVSFLSLGMALLLNTTMAQRINSGFSSIGYGEQSINAVSGTQFLSDVGIALSDRQFPNIQNPASISYLQEPSLDLGLSYNYKLLQKDQSEMSSKYSGFNHAFLGIPIKPNRIGFLAGIKPFSKVSYLTEETHEDENGYFQNASYYGDGGLNQVYFGLSYKPISDSIHHLSFGYSGSYIFGGIQKDVILENGIPDSYLYNKTETQYTSDFISELGVLYSFKFSKNKLSAGLTYTFKKDLKTSKETIANTFQIMGANEILKDTLHCSNIEGYFTYPSAIGFGLGYLFNESVEVLLNYKSSSWSKASGENETYKDENNYGLGIRFKPKAFTGTRGVFKKSIYYLSASHTQSRYLIDKERLSSNNYGAGLSIPIGSLSKSSSFINLGINYQNFSEHSLHGKMHSVQFLLGFNFTPGKYDRWFATKKID